MEIGFTLCFIQHNDKILMLYRNKAPNQFKWNGVGGKIEAGESPIDSCQREIQEETGLHIEKINIQFRAICTWNKTGGMFVFLAKSSSDQVISGQEGKLEWKSLDWIKTSGQAVSNIPIFLPYILDLNNKPIEFAFSYNDDEEMIGYEMLPDSPLIKNYREREECQK